MGKIKQLPIKKTVLTLEERIVLGGSLPQQGAFEKLIISKDLQRKLEVTEKEIKDFSIQSIGTNIGWNAKGVKAKFTYEFTELQKICIKDTLNKLSTEEKLPMGLVNLYKEFCL